MTRTPYGAILCTLVACCVSPVQAQQILDRYTAEIGAQDRVNSRETPLTQPGQILAQDRANFHRFGIRHAGDTPDRTFTSTEARQGIESLLSRGTMEPRVYEAVTGGGSAWLDVQIIGANGRADRLVVTMADSAMSSPAVPQAGALQSGAPRTVPPKQITGGPAAPGQAQWTFASGHVGGVTVASANLLRDGALLATLRCTASAASGPVLGVDPRAGVLTLQLSPAMTGPQVEGGRTAKLHFGTLPSLPLPLTFDPEMQVYSVSRLLTRRLSDDLERGARFSLTTQIAGQIHAPLPQDVGMALASTCGARGLDASVTPSFDCTRPQHPSEMLICYDPDLAALDRDLGAALAAASDLLKASQPAWISARNGCSVDAECIAGLTKDRIAMLSGNGSPGMSGAAPASPSSAIRALPGFGAQATADGAAARGSAGVSSTPSFKLMDATPSPENGEVIVGKQNFMDRFLLWTLGQNPALAANRTIQFRLSSFDFPPHLPEVPPTESTGERAQARLEAAAPLYADSPPHRVVLEETMYLQQAEPGMPGPLNLHGGFATMIGTTPAIVQIELRDRGAGASGSVRLDLDTPFYLPYPENFTPVPHSMLQGGKGKSLALIEITVSDPVPAIRGDRYLGGSAKAVISKVTLVYRPRQRNARNQMVDGPDQILHVWESGGGLAAQVERPADPAAIASLFGGGVSNGRYVLNPRAAPKPFVDETRGVLQSSSPTELVSTAMQLAAVIATQPERTLAPELTEYLMRNLLTEPERVELFPLNIATQMHNDAPSELELRAAYAKADQGMRDRIAGRSPTLPLPLRFAAQVSIGEYDFSSGGFPVSRVRNPGPWIPGTTKRQPVTTLAPDFIKMSPEDAQALLDRLSRTGTNGRSLVLVLDYSLDALGFRSVRSGPITRDELGGVSPSFTIASMAYYLPDDPAQPIMPIDIPDDAVPRGPKVAKPPPEGGFTTGGGLPDEVLYTSAHSLLGAIDLRDQEGTLVNDALRSAYDVLPPEPRSTYETRREAFRSDLRAQARDSYWVGAIVQIQPYDAQLGGFPVSDVNFDPVPYQQNTDTLDPPALIPAEPEDYEILRLPDAAVPALQKIIGNQRTIVALFKVTPVATVNDRRLGRGLTISAPVEAIFDDDRRGVTPMDADLWAHVAAPKRIDSALPGAADAAEVEAPEALMLDPEGISLLALSLAPDAFDDTMFQRMLIERLLKERSIPADAPEGDAELVKPDKLAWRRFFTNPDQSLRADAVDALLPEFKAWTIARVAALPEILHLPIGNQHPETACRGFHAISVPQLDSARPYYRADLPGFLQPGQAIPSMSHNLYSSGRAQAGEDRIWFWEGTGKSTGPLSCQYISRGKRGIDPGLMPEDAGHIATTVIVRAQPDIGDVQEFPDSYTYRVSPDLLRFVPASELSAPPAGLAGMIVMQADVLGAVGYRSDRFGKGAKIVASIAPEDWAPLVAKPAASTDVLGLTLEMPRGAFSDALRELRPDAAFYETETPGIGAYSHAVAVHDPQSAETILGIYADHVPDKPIIAISRRIELDAAAVSMEALQASAIEKYGHDFVTQGEGHWLWGMLPTSEDSSGYCGDSRIFRLYDRAGVPTMKTDDTALYTDGLPITGTQFWSKHGWPIEFQGDPNQRLPTVEQCGPVVAVRAFVNGRTLVAVTWLFDRQVEAQTTEMPKQKRKKVKIEF